jgi:drug/metabolite transporter (DMT)-like permease
VLIAIVGEFMLGEHISGLRWAGIVLISVGVMIVGETKPDTVHATGIEDDEEDMP